MIRSRWTFAITDAADTDAQSRSALILVCTRGSVLKPSTSASPRVSQSWLPSSSTTASSTGAPAATSSVIARRPAIARHAMMPSSSISSALASPTAQ